MDSNDIYEGIQKQARCLKRVPKNVAAVHTVYHFSLCHVCFRFWETEASRAWFAEIRYKIRTISQQESTPDNNYAVVFCLLKGIDLFVDMEGAGPKSYTGTRSWPHSYFKFRVTVTVM